ncbi:MAG: helix-turn-helix domain-containing protein [Opitutaceae bacterium]|nr:helix-turn-helix domain-containing protein [Opitutaceae bacterium]
MPDPDTPYFFSPNQLARRWSLHQESVRRMVRDGRLPALRLGKRVRIALHEVEAFEDEHRINRGKEVVQ